MNHWDIQLEQRVWQRVRGDTERPGLQALLTAEQSAAAAYRQLLRSARENEKALLRRLYAREQAHARCLLGMHRLQTGQPLSVRTPPPESDHPEATLRKCYQLSLKAIQAYSAWENDRDHGHVFSQLRVQEQEHCRMLLELLGMLP